MQPPPRQRELLNSSNTCNMFACEYFQWCFTENLQLIIEVVGQIGALFMLFVILQSFVCGFLRKFSFGDC